MNKTMLKLIISLGIVLAAVFSFFFPVYAEENAHAYAQPTTIPCGDGYASDNYGFSYNPRQPHWTVNWEGYVSEETVQKVDVILDELNEDNIAQTMLLFKPVEEVGDRVNCAVHFLRYMKLGQPSGERRDNGFTFLIVLERDAIDVHYGVGLGLPALTAQGLTPLNRLAEKTYQDSGSLDEALLALIEGFDEYARSKYQPYRLQQPTAINLNIDPQQLASPSGCILTCLICVILLVIFIVILTLLRFLFRGGGNSRPGRGFRIYPMPRPPSRWSGGGSGRSSFPKIRGGGGSGRANRGN